MINIIHIVDRNRVSSVNKEAVWDASASPVVLPLVMAEYNKYPIIMGYNTWKSTGEKKIGKVDNIVVSRISRKLPRGIKSAKDIIHLAKDKKVYNLIGGCNLLNSVPFDSINSINLYMLRKDCLSNGKITDFTVFPEHLYDITTPLDINDLYQHRYWSKECGQLTTGC